MDDLQTIAAKTLKRPHRSRGKVIVRELVQLKQLATDPNGFPISREYRAFVYKGELLKYGFYWDEYEDHGISTQEIQSAIEHLVSQVTTVVDVPFLSIDIAQLAVSEEWIVIELGDSQFTGLSQIPVLELWSKIKDFKL